MRPGLAGRIADTSIGSKLTPLLPLPGHTPEEVENRLLIPLENVLSGIEGVEYVYSHAESGFGLVTVRYEVGRNMEESLVKLYATLLKNADRMPPGLAIPLVKTVTIDDVPFFTVGLSGEDQDPDELRALADELRVELESVPDVRDVTVLGGSPREIRVEPLPERLAAFGVDAAHLADRLRGENVSLDAGEFVQADEVVRLKAGSFLTSARDVEAVVLDVRDGRLIRVGDVATVTDGPGDVATYTFHGAPGDALQPLVTLAVSKRAGADATALGRALETKLSALHGWTVPRGVSLDVTRNYGETAREKVTTLQLHLVLAILAVGVVVALSMGWRSALVVMTAVPVTFALTLFVYRIFGYTLNRVTLFALIFVTGIVIDDSIIVVENMHRHFAMKDGPLRAAARAAVDEVGNPTILATLTVIAAVLPMLFVSGLMGPYMSPMPIGATLAMSFSLLVAFVGAPWLAFRLLRREGTDAKDDAQGAVGSDGDHALERTKLYRFYRAVMQPLLDRPRLLWSLMGAVVVLLVLSGSLFFTRAVPVKMLPFDDKNEIQIVLDLPEGTPLERTAAVALDVAGALEAVPEVANVQVYAGTAAPFNFNGLIRHYYLRRGHNVADIQVNLVDKSERGAQSHEVALRLRPIVQAAAVAAAPDARAKVVEVPPGPPVLSTLVAEVYGRTRATQEEVARAIRARFEEHESVVDVDWSLVAPQREVRLVVDEDRAALSGVSKAAVAQALRISLNGEVATYLSEPAARTPVPVRVRLGEGARSGIDRLGALHLVSPGGDLVPVGELVETQAGTIPQVIDRKNGQRVVYVTAEVAGEEESPVYAILDLRDRLAEIQLPTGARLGQLYTRQPGLAEQPVMKWDGEWQITYEVFRDLGIAFAGALALIYVLIVGWFGSLTTPLIMLAAIPLTLVGIAPGHWLFGAFFTATSMIGMIALAGIMVRNGILLIDYLEVRLAAGVPLASAIIEAGAVRTRPIVLTAGTVVIGAGVILFDPIFEGLAVSLISGAIASTILTLVVVPGLYYLVRREKKKEIAA
jgi:multidrug efflux pump subunit AcrB